jgi:hypothetical protein
MGDKKKDKHAKLDAKADDRAAKPGEPKAKRSGEATSLPQTRTDLLALHRETRSRRNAARHGSREHVEAIELIGRIEIEIARIERAVDPPLV